MNAIVVMNGQFYSGENVQDNKLNFSPDRSKAVLVDERRLRFITQSVLRWFMNGEIELKRLEIIRIGGGEDRCANVVNAKLESANVRIVKKRVTAVMCTQMIVDGSGSEAANDKVRG